MQRSTLCQERQMQNANEGNIEKLDGFAFGRVHKSSRVVARFCACFTSR